jgi:membrane-associated protease RseP (regulator of RpoE activity)
MGYIIVAGAVFISLFVGNFYKGNLQEKEEKLAQLFPAFFSRPQSGDASGGDANTPAEQKKAINAILETKPNPNTIKDYLRKGRTYSNPDKSDLGWQVYDHSCIDGVNRPYCIYIPKDYYFQKKYMVLFDLHGGVSRPDLWTKKELTDELKKQPDWLWAEEAKDNEFIYVIPQGQGGAEWWTTIGAQNVLGILREIKQKFNVDENKVFVSGFSDGGSGSYYMALHYSTPFAGFISLNGHVGVAGASGEPVYLSNLSNKPLYIVNTGQDPLYPAKEIIPLIDGMKQAGANLTFKVYEEIGHTVGYADTEKPIILHFMNQTDRAPYPATLDWETAADSADTGKSPKDGRLHWLKIDKIENVGNNDTSLTDVNPMLKSERVIIGVALDNEYTGAGAKCKAIMDGTLAEKLAMKAGDIITGLDTIQVGELTDLRKVLQYKKPGDEIVIRVLRGKKNLTLKGQFETTEPKPAFKRNKISGRIVATKVKNRVDVKCQNISAYTLFISPDQFDLKKNIEVYTNGNLSFKGKVKPDVEFMLKQTIEDMDRSMVFSNKIDISVSPQVNLSQTSQPQPATTTEVAPKAEAKITPKQASPEPDKAKAVEEKPVQAVLEIPTQSASGGVSGKDTVTTPPAPADTLKQENKKGESFFDRCKRCCRQCFQRLILRKHQPKEQPQQPKNPAKAG